MFEGKYVERSPRASSVVQQKAGVTINEQEMQMYKNYWNFIIGMLEFCDQYMKQHEMPLDDIVSALDRLKMDFIEQHFKAEMKK